MLRSSWSVRRLAAGRLEVRLPVTISLLCAIPTYVRMMIALPNGRYDLGETLKRLSEIYKRVPVAPEISEFGPVTALFHPALRQTDGNLLVQISAPASQNTGLVTYCRLVVWGAFLRGCSRVLSHWQHAAD